MSDKTNNKRAVKLISAINTIFQKASFKTNENELEDLKAITPEDLESCLEYLRNYPEADARRAWHYLQGLCGNRKPDFDGFLENQHPLVEVFCKTLVALAAVDAYFLIDLDEYLPEAPRENAPRTLEGPEDLDVNHPAIVGLQKLYAHSHQLPDNVVHALSQLADAVEQDSAVLEKFLATTTDEVEQAKADGGFSAAEAQGILDNSIQPEVDPQPEGLSESLGVEQPTADVGDKPVDENTDQPEGIFANAAEPQQPQEPSAPEATQVPEGTQAPSKKSARPKAAN